MSCINIKQGGSWVAAQPYIKVAGVWEQATSVWVKAAGVWEEISCNGTIVAPAGLWQSDADPTSPYYASAGFRFNTDGTYSKRNATGSGDGWEANSGNWLSGGSAANFDIKWTTTSGGPPTGGPVASWLNMGTVRSVSLTRTTTGSQGWNADIEIRNASTLTVVYTGTHVIYVENGTG